MPESRASKVRLIAIAVFVAAVVVSIWLPGVVLAQEWRLEAHEKAMAQTDDRVRVMEAAVPDLRGSIGRDAEAIGRQETRLANVEKVVDEIRRGFAVVDFIKWEATILAVAFGSVLGFVVRYIVNSFRHLRREIIAVRRDARIARNDDFQMIGIPLAKLLEKDHPELAQALQDRMYRRQSQEDRAEDEPSSADGVPTFRSWGRQ